MKPVHSYHVPTYSIVPPYQFARYRTISSCHKLLSIIKILTVGITLWENEQLLRKRPQSSSTTGLTSRYNIIQGVDL